MSRKRISSLVKIIDIGWNFAEAKTNFNVSIIVINEPRVQESVVESIYVKGAKTLKIATGKKVSTKSQKPCCFHSFLPRTRA